MSSRRDEVEQGVHSVVLETGVTFNSRLLGEDIVVLALNVAHNFLEPAKTRQFVNFVMCRADIRKFVVNAITKPWRVDHSQSDTDTLLLKFCNQVTVSAAAPGSLKSSPIFAGLILIPVSTCAVSGSSMTL